MQEKSHNESHIFSRIETLRIKGDYSWDQTASALGVNRSYLFHIKAGRKNPSAKFLYRLECAEQSLGLLPGNNSAQPPPTPAPIMQEVQALDDLPGKVPNLGKCLYPSECDLPAKLDEIRREMAEAREATQKELGELKSLLTDLLADGGLEALKRHQARSKRAG